MIIFGCLVEVPVLARTNISFALFLLIQIFLVFNDLWKYDIGTNKWTWMSGSNVGNRYGIYGMRGVSSNSTVPGSRAFSVSWTNLDDSLWLFGGSGYGASKTGFLNDLWKYNTTLNQWTWMSGSNATNQKGVYHSLVDQNFPGGRYSAVSWSDKKYNNLWLFGGVIENPFILREFLDADLIDYFKFKFNFL